MSEVVSVSEMFGKDVFNDAVMKDRLPKSVYKKLKKTIEDGAELDPSIADVVAHAMKDWAIEHGATHFTHWFQPLTGVFEVQPDSALLALTILPVPALLPALAVLPVPVLHSSDPAYPEILHLHPNLMPFLPAHD